MSPYALYPLTTQRAVSHHTGLAGELGIAAYKIVEALSAVWNWIDRKNRRAESIRELSRLSDRMLKDIGIHRGEIRYVVESMLDAPVARPVEPKPERTVRPAPRTKLPIPVNDNNERRFSAMI
jgi:uncharacterized protein YjiS (DUF1127 family)